MTAKRYALILFPALVAACAVNPITGDRHVVLSSESQESTAGANAAKEVADNMGLLDDAIVVDYVAAIGKRLVDSFPNGDTGYTFRVVDIPEPNAFALPGGFVYVSRGLLTLVNSEDELATVIGHEIGHVAARHAARRLAVAAPFAVVTGITSFATGLVSPLLGNLVAGVGGLTAALVVAPYSREQEREADRLGMEIVARAGWNPVALASVLKSLEREEGLHGGKSERFSFLASHPSTPERVDNVVADAPGFAIAENAPLVADRAALLRYFDGLIVGADPADGVVVGTRFLHPSLDFAVSFPDGWRIQNSRRAVVAVAPQGDGISMLRIAGPSDDFEALVKRAEVDLRTESSRTTIGRSKAARMEVDGQTKDGTPSRSYLTWIDYRGRVLAIFSAESNTDFVYAGALRNVAASFARLSSKDWSSIQATRLRLHAAKAGEKVATIATLTSSEWSAEEIAVANAVQLDTPLTDNFVVKFAMPEPFRPTDVAAK